MINRETAYKTAILPDAQEKVTARGEARCPVRAEYYIGEEAEKHWHQDKLHGIERIWDLKSKLAPGFPRYWLHGERARKPVYLKAITQDNTLPSLLPEDDNPNRIFPSLIEDRRN